MNLNKKIQFPHQIQEKSFDLSLYPCVKPFREEMLPVSVLHSLYFAVFGNPLGIPLVVLHGGPGAGCYEAMTRFFDLSRYYVVMLDQRGAMRSLPLGCMEENTPHLLISDMEKLRIHLKIDKWMIFGGSWGSTLGILYGQAHPNRCIGFILRGIFLARDYDDQHVLQAMGRIFPEAYEQMIEAIPREERADLCGAFSLRVMDPDPAIHLPAAKAFLRFNLICSFCRPDLEFINHQLNHDKGVLSVTRTFFFYANNDFFLKQNQVIAEMAEISNLPAILVHGRWDIVTLPEMAYSLHQKWDNSSLWMVPLGGHSSAEPAIAKALVAATDAFADQIES